MVAFLCLRRGVSSNIFQSLHKGDFSLPTQRCFFGSSGTPNFGSLFSAYAEVFPYAEDALQWMVAFLCLRRGVSNGIATTYTQDSFSLPTQRCFLSTQKLEFLCWLFSAYAEVFLNDRKTVLKKDAFLCLRRGVSALQRSNIQTRYFSLPTQRCFQMKRRACELVQLFSAYAEVFLSSYSR